MGSFLLFSDNTSQFTNLILICMLIVCLYLMLYWLSAVMVYLGNSWSPTLPKSWIRNDTWAAPPVFSFSWNSSWEGKIWYLTIWSFCSSALRVSGWSWRASPCYDLMLYHFIFVQIKERIILFLFFWEET